MRRVNIYYITVILTIVISLTAFNSCYDDDSSIADELIPNIIIRDFNADSYTVTSYVGDSLNLVADVISGYSDEQLTYNWYLIDLADEQTYRSDEDEPYKRMHIATGRELNYAVNLFPGDYTVVLEVNADNGYLVSKTVTLHAVTNFSEGYYILKATNDGNTELDLYNAETGFFMENVLASVHGSSMHGLPQCLSTTTSHGYIDSETNAMSSSNIVTVTTQNGDLAGMRTSDLKTVLDRNNILFDDMTDDELPYRIVQCSWCNIFITNKGLRSQYQASMSLSTSGKYGLTNGVGASQFVAYDETGSNLFFWDAQTHSICTCDYNGTVSIGSDDKYRISNLANMDCMHVGYCGANSNIVFVLNYKANNTKQLVCLTSSFASGFEVRSMLPMTGRRINSAVRFTTSTNSAAFVYGLLEDGTIWAFDMETNTEQQIMPQGIDDDENIDYISDQMIGSCQYGGINYFVVGTYNGGDYILRFYKLLGGLPDGEPIYTITGKGRVKAIHYTGGSESSFIQSPLQD